MQQAELASVSSPPAGRGKGGEKRALVAPAMRLWHRQGCLGGRGGCLVSLLQPSTPDHQGRENTFGTQQVTQG